MGQIYYVIALHHERSTAILSRHNERSVAILPRHCERSVAILLRHNERSVAIQWGMGVSHFTMTGDSNYHLDCHATLVMTGVAIQKGKANFYFLISNLLYHQHFPCSTMFACSYSIHVDTTTHITPDVV